jgi:hypothetical protein
MQHGILRLMKNLAGVPECDDYIRVELTKARINIVPCDLVGSEVPYRLEGQLGPFHFRRAWYYWVANGLMPLKFAQELYADPIGKTDIRVAGHCGCPPPEKPWIRYIDPNGVHLVPQEEYDEFVRCFKEKVPKIMEEQNFRFSDDLERDGEAYVECYHIDTQEGLRLFADVIHNRMKGYTKGISSVASFTGEIKDCLPHLTTSK